MKLLQITTVDTTIQTFLIPHLQMFQREGYEVEVACRVTTFKEAIENAGFTLFPISFSRSMLNPQNLIAFIQIFVLMRRQKYDIVATTTPVASVLSRIAATLAGVPLIIYTVHGFHFSSNGNLLVNAFYVIIEKVASVFTDGIITTNQEDYEAAQKLYPRDRVFFMHGVAISADFFQQANVSKADRAAAQKHLGIQDNEKVVGMVAEFNPGKRHEDFFEAAQILIQERMSVKFVLVGEGRLRKRYEKLVEQKGIGGYFVFTGFREDVRPILSLCNVLVLPSIREGLPRSISEGMAMEIPVIAANVRGSKDVVQDGVNGFLVEPKNPTALAEALRRIFKNDALAQRMGKEGRRIILKRFDEPKVLKEELAAYTQLVKDVL
ncbi:MAG: glycosyltransferase family 4 protein [Patescibacteria group bacterium]|nr:glycosyltransferase family 4 protein [Patescibacteria group bacterium]